MRSALLVLFALGTATAMAAEGHSDAELDHLVTSYPDFLEGHRGNVLRWKDGTEMPFDDGKGTKDFEARLNSPDLEDEFYVPYAIGRQGICQSSMPIQAGFVTSHFSLRCTGTVKSTRWKKSW